VLFTDVIRKKRDGGELTGKEICFFVDGLADESIPAEQVSSLAMAIFLNSMSTEEMRQLTTMMAHSGTVIDWSKQALDGPVVDKHSTGGVGDKVSFILAPLAAACGCYVPMISGRGLGHTGGTTDKAEAIPGYNAMPDFELFQATVRNVGCAIIGQTGDLAPADKRLYAIRDTTATVESVPLITASILSKKMAAGLDGLVMDVKFGSGAFMPDIERAGELASSITATANAAGLDTRALLTDMNECLGKTAGNALEVLEATEFLTGQSREPRLLAVVTALATEMLIVGKIETDADRALNKVQQALDGGQAAERFQQMIAALGGPADFLEHHRQHLQIAPAALAVHPQRSGYLTAVNAVALGNAIIELKGGRRTMSDRLDLSTGLAEIASIGSVVDEHTPLAVVHTTDEEHAAAAASLVRAACTISDSPPAERDIVSNTRSGQ